MAKKKNWISYENASKIAREAGCASRKQFMEWHKRSGVKDIPKQPNRVYAEWEGWPEFLGTTNIFASDKDSEQRYRKYWEAVRWSQKWCAEKEITTGQAWKHAYTADRDSGRNEIPADIPKHPENFYDKDWTGWPAWLGKGVMDKIAAQQMEISLMCIATSSYQAPNVIHIVMAKDGEAQLVDLLFQKALTPRRIYKFDGSVAQRLKQVMEEGASMQPDGSWICRNLNNLLSEIAFELEPYTVQRPDAFKPLFNPTVDYEVSVEDKNHKNPLTNGESDFV